MQLEDFLDAMRIAHKGSLPLNDEQKKAIQHDYKLPLWIIAGPGTGKTHTLSWLVLKRILVDGIEPKRIFLTTFTRKAAAEIESRLILNRQKLISAGLSEAIKVDIPQMQVGTLHSLCSCVLQDKRYDPTLRVRVLEDALVQQFFVRRTKNPLVECDDIGFWVQFGMANPNDSFAPNKAARTEGACKLFNRMTENSVDIHAMLDSGDPNFVKLADAYKSYQQSLFEKHRTDQSHLQRHFLDYLETSDGKEWLGNGFTVVVDEYQDTNPIQEELYFKLTGKGRDLTVVGDDDQSLYRFRGATVEALIDFDKACEIYLQATPIPIYLNENRRSHPRIVKWVNDFIDNHPEMKDPVLRVRAPNKPALKAATEEILGNYPAVMGIIEKTAAAVARKLVATINELKDKEFVDDYSQIAILTFSTRETNRAIGTYTAALRDAGIPLCNPRSGSTQKDQTFLGMIGALSYVLDPTLMDLHYQLPRGVPQYIDSARQQYQVLEACENYPELVAYVQECQKAIRNAPFDPDKAQHFLTRQGGKRVTLSGLLYKLLAQEPFATELTQAEQGERLKALNLILSEYESIYDNGELRISDKPELDGSRRISSQTIYPLYSVFIEGIHDGLNDPEDEEISIQPRLVNVMTIHQSKGLEFEVVIVLRPDKSPFLGDTHVLEDVFDPFITRLTKPAARRSQQLRAAEDAIRLFYVAYSRAKRLLILTGDKVDKWDRVLGMTATGSSLNSKAALAGIGVHML